MTKTERRFLTAALLCAFIALTSVNWATHAQESTTTPWRPLIVHGETSPVDKGGVRIGTELTDSSSSFYQGGYGLDLTHTGSPEQQYVPPVAWNNGMNYVAYADMPQEITQPTGTGATSTYSDGTKAIDFGGVTRVLEGRCPVCNTKHRVLTSFQGMMIACTECRCVFLLGDTSDDPSVYHYEGNESDEK